MTYENSNSSFTLVEQMSDSERAQMKSHIKSSQFEKILNLNPRFRELKNASDAVRIGEDLKVKHRLCARDYADLIANMFELLYYKPAENYVIYNSESGLYENNQNLLINAINAMQIGTKECLTRSVISDVDMTLSSYSQLFTKPDIIFAPNHIIKFENCIFNLKTKQIVDPLDEAYNYKFVKKCTYNYKSLAECSSHYISLVEEMLGNWADGNSYKIRLILQIIFATIEGFGRYRYIVLRAGGGNGKSTFLEILRQISSGYYVDLNLQDISKDNVLCQISTDTKLLVGDEIATNMKLTHDDVARFKMLVASTAGIQVFQKFKDNAKIKTNAVMIQSANTDMKFFEATDAIEDRLLIFDWTPTNYRKLNIESPLAAMLKNLNLGIIDRDFIETIIAYAIARTDYFERFTLSDDVKQAVQDLVYDTDTLAQFVNYMQELGLLYYSHIPMSTIYALYKDWLEIENAGSKPLSSFAFSKKIKNYLGKLGYIKPANDVLRLKYTKLYEFNYKSVNINTKSQHFENNLKSATQTQRSLVNPDFEFKEADINDCRNAVENRDFRVWKNVKNRTPRFAILAHGVVCDMLNSSKSQMLPTSITMLGTDFFNFTPQNALKIIEDALFV